MVADARTPSLTPTRAHDVAVVGAGIVGLSIAYHAAASGLRTIVYERSGIASEASGVQPGGVRQQWSTDVNCLLARESYGFYRELNEHLRSRVRPVLEPCGYVFLAHSPETLAGLISNVELQNSHGIPSRILSPPELSELIEGLSSEEVLGGSYCSQDGYFDRPQSVVEAFAQTSISLGVEIEYSNVVSLRPDGAGWELQLAGGRRVLAAQVVLATGYDTNSLLTHVGYELPLEKVAKCLFLSEPIRECLLEPLVVSQELHFAAKQLSDGRILASDLNAAGPSSTRAGQWRDHIRSTVQRLLPILEYVTFPLLVEGFYDMTPDSQAIVGCVGDRGGLWVATGFSGHGFMIAPAVGRALGVLLRGEDPGAVFDALRPDRFSKSALAIETQVV